jgi:hypothetical protein
MDGLMQGLRRLMSAVGLGPKETAPTARLRCTGCGLTFQAGEMRGLPSGAQPPQSGDRAYCARCYPGQATPS